MHELGIVFHIIDTVEQVGRENGVKQERCVSLVVCLFFCKVFIKS